MQLNSFPVALAPGLAAVLLLGVANYAANHLAPRHPRYAYTVLVVLLCGTAAPAFALRLLAGAGILDLRALSANGWPFALALAGGGAFLALSIRDEPAEQLRRLPRLLISLFAPSLAEVLVFVGIVYGIADFLVRPAFGAVASAIAATLVTSISFGLYHLTHAAPWNSLRMVRILLIVWLFIGGFYALTHDLWATALLNTLLATIGFVKNRVTGPEEQPLSVSALLDAVGIAAVAAIAFSP